jgi:hypothetical protein
LWAEKFSFSVFQPPREQKTEKLKSGGPEDWFQNEVRPLTCATTCYPIEPGVWIHHPWNGCTTPMPEYERPPLPLSKECWHCGGEGFCLCVTCSEDGGTQCVVCHGTGKRRKPRK